MGMLGCYGTVKRILSETLQDKRLIGNNN